MLSAPTEAGEGGEPWEMFGRMKCEAREVGLQAIGLSFKRPKAKPSMASRVLGLHSTRVQKQFNNLV